jgi:hypothetical protein
LTEERLQIVEGGNSNTVSKSILRKFMMPFIEKSGYLNTVYSALFRKIVTDSGRTQAQVEIMDARVRRALADADARIALLEKRIEGLNQERK